MTRARLVEDLRNSMVFEERIGGIFTLGLWELHLNPDVEAAALIHPEHYPTGIVCTFDQAGRPPIRRFARLVAPGRYVATFRVASGGSGPATVRISATDRGGHPNATVRRVWVV